MLVAKSVEIKNILSRKIYYALISAENEILTKKRCLDTSKSAKNELMHQEIMSGC